MKLSWKPLRKDFVAKTLANHLKVKPEIGKLIVGAVLNAVTAMIASGRNRKPNTRQA